MPFSARLPMQPLYLQGKPQQLALPKLVLAMRYHFYTVQHGEYATDSLHYPVPRRSIYPVKIAIAVNGSPVPIHLKTVAVGPLTTQ